MKKKKPERVTTETEDAFKKDVGFTAHFRTKEARHLDLIVDGFDPHEFTENSTKTFHKFTSK